MAALLFLGTRAAPSTTEAGDVVLLFLEDLSELPPVDCDILMPIMMPQDKTKRASGSVVNQFQRVVCSESLDGSWMINGECGIIRQPDTARYRVLVRFSRARLPSYKWCFFAQNGNFFLKHGVQMTNLECFKIANSCTITLPYCVLQ